MRSRTSSLGLRQLLAFRAGRLLAGLPPKAQVRLSGRSAVTIDGNTLAPEIQLTLALLERRREPAPETLSPEQARLARRRLAAVFAGPPEPVGAVEDLTLDSEVPLRARHYAPAEPDALRPLLVYYHGGGFTYGDLDTHDGVCRLLCRRAGAHVLAVDYRLAPEHRFPAAVEDARAAFAWAVQHAERLGASPLAVGVGGDSAGGNLAAVVSQLAARDGGPAPAVQLLIYPATDFTQRRRSRDLFAEGFLLTEAEMRWFEQNYLGPECRNADDPRVSPLLAADLSGLPPAIVVTAGFDPLRDEGEEYAQSLARAGNAVIERRFATFIHAFIGGTGVSHDSREAVAEIAGMLRAAFALAAGSPTAAARTELGSVA